MFNRLLSLFRHPFVSVFAASCLIAIGTGCTGSSATAAASPTTGSEAAPTGFLQDAEVSISSKTRVWKRLARCRTVRIGQRRIRDTISSHLTQKGYKRVRGGNPGMLVAYHVITSQGDAVSINSNYTGYHLTDAQQSQANLNALIPPNGSGTLVVDVIDPVKKEVVWRTSKQTTLNSLSTAEERNKALDGIVADALSTIPARS